jgi:hypothetical protein
MRVEGEAAMREKYIYIERERERGIEERYIQK